MATEFTLRIKTLRHRRGKTGHVIEGTIDGEPVKLIFPTNNGTLRSMLIELFQMGDVLLSKECGFEDEDLPTLRGSYAEETPAKDTSNGCPPHQPEVLGGSVVQYASRRRCAKCGELF